MSKIYHSLNDKNHTPKDRSGITLKLDDIYNNPCFKQNSAFKRNIKGIKCIRVAHSPYEAIRCINKFALQPTDGVNAAAILRNIHRWSN